MNDELHFHPLADLVPKMTDEQFKELVADVKKNGLQQPIVLFEGKILDGRHRSYACKAAGIDLYDLIDIKAGDGWIKDPVAYVISANIHRRHLTAEQKRDLIAKLIKADPAKSDRQIAAAAKASPTTVGTV